MPPSLGLASRGFRIVLLTLYGSPPFLIVGSWRLDPDWLGLVVFLNLALFLVGFLGSLSWCIRHLPAYVAEVRWTLTLLAIFSALYLAVLFPLVASGR
jgi:hypothetical protein